MNTEGSVLAVREMPAPRQGGRAHRVVILGGGFARVTAARSLTRMLGRRRDVYVELLSEENYFVFQPLLPEVAAGSIIPNHVVNPIRELAVTLRREKRRVSSRPEIAQVYISGHAQVLEKTGRSDPVSM